MPTASWGAFSSSVIATSILPRRISSQGPVKPDASVNERSVSGCSCAIRVIAGAMRARGVVGKYPTRGGPEVPVRTPRIFAQGLVAQPEGLLTACEQH